MKPLCLYILSSVFTLLISSITGSPVKFEDDRSLEHFGRSAHQHEESRVFHAHAIKKRKKKKLLHCLLNLQRSNPQVDARTLFFNYVNLEYTQHGGGNGGYNDENGGYNNCLSQLGGGSQGGGDGDDGDSGTSGLGGIGEGINNLGSLIGQAPSNLISSVGDGIKPVFENPERYLNRYIIRPLYRSLRPLYRLF